MTHVEFEVERSEHPLDVLERLASLNEWTFDRADDDEMSIAVPGSWTEYHVAFTWIADVEALHVACAFDLKVPDRRRNEMLHLVSLVNEQMWVGHFDLWSSENVVMYRHALLLAGGAEPTPGQCEMMMKTAVGRLRALLPGLPVRASGPARARARRSTACCSKPKARPDASARPGPRPTTRMTARRRDAIRRSCLTFRQVRQSRQGCCQGRCHEPSLPPPSSWSAPARWAAPCSKAGWRAASTPRRPP